MTKVKEIYGSVTSKMSVAKLNLGLVVILFTFLCYTLFAPIVPAEYQKPVVRNPDNLVAGRTITYDIETCRFVGESVATTITRQLVPVDKEKNLSPINLSTDVVSNQVRCLKSTRTLIIPYSTPAGEYRLVIRGIYAIIPLRTPITVSAESDILNIKTTPVEQQIRELIEANEFLRGQLDRKIESDDMTSTDTSRSTQTTPPVNNATNNTTTNNTVNNPRPTPTPTPENSPPNNPAPSILDRVFNLLGGGAIKFPL